MNDASDLQRKGLQILIERSVLIHGLLPTMEDRATLGSICSLISETVASRSGASVCFYSLYSS